MDEKMETMRAVMSRKSELLPEIAEDLQKKEAKWKEMDQAQHLETISNDLQAQLIWSKVALIEKVVVIFNTET
jgi:hypothetical protein